MSVRHEVRWCPECQRETAQTTYTQKTGPEEGDIAYERWCDECVHLLDED